MSRDQRGFRAGSCRELEPLNLPEFGVNELGVHASSMDIWEQYELGTSDQDLRGMRQHGKRITLHGALMTIASITAIVAITYMILQCFGPRGTMENVDATARKLAEGGTERLREICAMSHRAVPERGWNSFSL